MIILECVANSICYLTFFVFFSWDKIYYIIKRQGNDPNTYFIYEKNEKCFVHNSYTCGCKLKKKKEDNSTTMEKYILFYKFCSTVFNFEGGKLKYIKTSSKLDLIE